MCSEVLHSLVLLPVEMMTSWRKCIKEKEAFLDLRALASSLSKRLSDLMTGKLYIKGFLMQQRKA